MIMFKVDFNKKNTRDNIGKQIHNVHAPNYRI